MIPRFMFWVACFSLSTPTFLFAKDRITVELASSTNQLNHQAQNILHDVYIVEQGWVPKNDTTEIKVINPTGSLPRLVNNYERVALTWVAKVNGTPVGTIRAAGTIDGKLEVERYQELPALIAEVKATMPNKLWEVNRLAVLGEFRTGTYMNANGNRTTVYQALINAVNQRAERSRWTLVAAPDVKLLKSLSRLGWTRMKERFKYNVAELNEVAFVFRFNLPIMSAPVVPNCQSMFEAGYHR